MHEAALDHLWWLHQVLLTAPFCGPCNHRIIDRCHDNKACRCVLRWNGLLVVSHPASFPDLLQTRLSLPPEARTRSWAAPSLAYGNPAISHLHRPVAASRSHSRCLHFLLSRPPPESTPAFAEGHKSRVSATAIIHHPGCPVEPLTNASTSSMSIPGCPSSVPPSSIFSSQQRRPIAFSCYPAQCSIPSPCVRPSLLSAPYAVRYSRLAV